MEGRESEGTTTEMLEVSSPGMGFPSLNVFLPNLISIYVKIIISCEIIPNSLVVGPIE